MIILYTYTKNLLGGGTGDSVLTLARQLEDLNSDFEILHMDLSSTSIDICKERAQYFGLDEHITWVTY